MATIFLSAKLAEFNLNLSFYLWIERGKHPFFFFFFQQPTGLSVVNKFATCERGQVKPQQSSNNSGLLQHLST